jgi:hypothetical protein
MSLLRALWRCALRGLSVLGGEPGSRYHAEFIRFRGSRVLQSLVPKSPRRRIGLPSPLSPLRFFWALGFSAPQVSTGLRPVKVPLMHFDAT